MKSIAVALSLLLSSPFAQAGVGADSPTCGEAEKNDLINYLYYDPSSKRQTDSFLLFQNGESILESYSEPFNETVKHNSWSAAKSFIGVLIGIAAEEGYFDENEKISKYIPELKTTATILDVLRMGSGIAFSEKYSGIPVSSDVVKMLYLGGRKNGITPFLVGLNNRDETPGEHFYYSSGDTNLLIELLRRVLPSALYPTYAWSRLFDRLGMSQVTFERDLNHLFIGSSYIYATPRDYARFGQMLANRGFYRGNEIISRKWWKLMNEVAPGVIKDPIVDLDRAYSLQITTNLPIPARHKPSQYPPLAQDALLSIGVQGQLIVAIPSTQTVMVRTANDPGMDVDRNLLFTKINAYVRSCGFPVNHAGDSVENREILLAGKSAEPLQAEINKTPILEYANIPRLLTTVLAKELCSCRFVMKLSEKECKRRVKSSLPVLPPIHFDTDRKTVRTAFLMHRGYSHWISEGEGCR